MLLSCVIGLKVVQHITDKSGRFLSIQSKIASVQCELPAAAETWQRVT